MALTFQLMLLGFVKVQTKGGYMIDEISLLPHTHYFPFIVYAPDKINIMMAKHKHTQILLREGEV